jgi:hypothetical protein
VSSPAPAEDPLITGSLLLQPVRLLAPLHGSDRVSPAGVLTNNIGFGVRGDKMGSPATPRLGSKSRTLGSFLRTSHDGMSGHTTRRPDYAATRPRRASPSWLRGPRDALRAIERSIRDGRALTGLGVTIHSGSRPMPSVENARNVCLDLDHAISPWGSGMEVT